jgi:hypothetical protein
MGKAKFEMFLPSFHLHGYDEHSKENNSHRTALTKNSFNHFLLEKKCVYFISPLRSYIFFVIFFVAETIFTDQDTSLKLQSIKFFFVVVSVRDSQTINPAK